MIGVMLAIKAIASPGEASVLADNPPHQAGAGAVADSCAACHRTHTAQADALLMDDQPALCYSCHGTGGTGANTVVQEGKLYGAGASFTALKAGGFESALIDTDTPNDVYPGPSVIYALGAAEPVTSAHTIDGSPGTLWANGAIDSGVGGSHNLLCCSCHDPHGNGQYRILKPVPSGSGAPTPVLVTDEDPKDYDTTNYINVWYVDGTEMSGWCAQCHTRCAADATGGHTDSGDDIFAYRHLSDGSDVYCGACHGEYGQGFVDHELTCIKCHAAHGTNATTYADEPIGPTPTAGGPPTATPAPGNSAQVPWPGGTPALGENTRLLKMDNRGICQKCHNK